MKREREGKRKGGRSRDDSRGKFITILVLMLMMMMMYIDVKGFAKRKVAAGGR